MGIRSSACDRKGEGGKKKTRAMSRRTYARYNAGEVDALSLDSQLKNRSRNGRRGAWSAVALLVARPSPFHRSADFPHCAPQIRSPGEHHPFFASPRQHRRVPPLAAPLPRTRRWTTVYRDYDARNGTKHHERQRLTNAGERGERKGDGDGDGGNGGGRSDTVVVVGSRYADTFAGCERPGQRRVNWRGVPSLARLPPHDSAPC